MRYHRSDYRLLPAVRRSRLPFLSGGYNFNDGVPKA